MFTRSSADQREEILHKLLLGGAVCKNTLRKRPALPRLCLCGLQRPANSRTTPPYGTRPTQRAKGKGHKCFSPGFPQRVCCVPPAPLQELPILHPASIPHPAPCISPLNSFPTVLSSQVLAQPDAPHHQEDSLFSSTYFQVHPPPRHTPSSPRPQRIPQHHHLPVFPIRMQKGVCWLPC